MFHFCSLPYSLLTFLLTFLWQGNRVWDKHRSVIFLHSCNNSNSWKSLNHFLAATEWKKRSSEGAECMEMRQLLFGDIRHGHFFLLLYILDMQMGQKILKTRIGMNFMDKIKFFYGKSPLQSDTCGTKIDGTNSFKLKVKNNSSWRGNTTHRSLLKCSVQIRMK